MTDDTKDDDEFDPADWFAKQFGGDAPKPETPFEPEQPAPQAAQPVTDSATPPVATPPATTPITPSATEPAPLAPFSWELDPPAALVPPASPPPLVEPSAAPPPLVEPAAAPPPLTEPPAAPPAPSLPTPDPLDQPTQAMDAAEFGADLAAFRPSEPPPIEPSLRGATEVMAAHELGTPGPESEGLAHNPLESLFGETQFRDYEGEPMIAIPTARQEAAVEEAAAAPPRDGIPRNQRILLWVAGGLVAALALVVLFLVGTRIAGSMNTPPAESAAPTPSATASVALAPGTPIVPVEPGVHHWSALQGGECLEPYESPWQDEYTVVACTDPHAAQMISRGQFAEIEGSSYPGFEDLASRINLLCTAPTVLDYAVAGSITDLQVAGSFAADEAEWNDGNRSYSCFVSRASGEPLTASVGVPQVVPTPTATPAP